jgi:hypothetical protein
LLEEPGLAGWRFDRWSGFEAIFVRKETLENGASERPESLTA